MQIKRSTTWVLSTLAILLITWAEIGLAQQKPLDSQLEEEVRVSLNQIEVTAWPRKANDALTCQGLTEEDFELTVNGRSRQITAVDWLGAPEAMEKIGDSPLAEVQDPPLTIVLFFDLWHLNVFYREFSACPVTKPLAFEEARTLVREQFRPGDRLLLVTFSGWPQIHEGWIRDPAHALRAIDRLEVSPFVMTSQQRHLHHHSWIAGMKSLLLALGRYPGRKEMFYLGDDFRFDDVALQVYDLAARAQSNQVSIHSVDLVWSCRSLPGPGCPDLVRGGLGCTDFRAPIALGYVSASTGGEVFGGSRTLADAVQTVRRMRGCKYLLSFPASRRDGKRSPSTRVRLLKKNLQLFYPTSFGNPKREPREREQQDALFLLPRFSQGIEAEVGLWPLRPSGKRKFWKGIIVARLKRTMDDPWPEELTRIELEVVANARSKIYGEFAKVIQGEDLRQFRDGQSQLLIFPVDKIRPGPNSVTLRGLGVGGDVSTNVRAWLDVPDLPAPGRAGPWMLVSTLARVRDQVTIMPALDGTLPNDHNSLVLAYGCTNEEKPFPWGQLVSEDGKETVAIPIDWLNTPERNGDAECGWLAGQIAPTLSPGLWSFMPPASLATRTTESLALEFRVVPGE